MNIPELKEKIVKLAQDYSELGINAKSDETNDKRKARKGKGKAAAKALVAALAAGGLGAGYYVADRKGYIQQLKNLILEMSKNNGQGLKDIPGNAYNGLVDLTAQGVQGFKDTFMGGDRPPEVTDGVGRATVLGGLGSLGLGVTVHSMGPSEREINSMIDRYLENRWKSYVGVGEDKLSLPVEGGDKARRELIANFLKQPNVAEAVELGMNTRHNASYRGRGGVNFDNLSNDLVNRKATRIEDLLMRPGHADIRPGQHPQYTAGGPKSLSKLRRAFGSHSINKISPLAGSALSEHMRGPENAHKLSLGERMAVNRRFRAGGYLLSALPLIAGLGFDVAKATSNYNEKKRQYAKQNESAKKK